MKQGRKEEGRRKMQMEEGRRRKRKKEEGILVIAVIMLVRSSVLSQMRDPSGEGQSTVNPHPAVLAGADRVQPDTLHP